MIMDNLLHEQKQSAELMESIREEHKKNLSLKRGLIVMGCFAVLLAVANIGTSFVAVKLVKDMKVTESNELVSLNGQRLGTTSRQYEFSFEDPANIPEARRRHLQGAAQSAACAEDPNCFLKGYLIVKT